MPVGGSRLPVEGLIPPPLNRDFAVIGSPIDRRDALEKVTGQARYSSDITLPGMLHAKLLRCPHAHARIKRIDVSHAAALPGVHAILTKDNSQDWCTYWYMIPQPAFPDELAYTGQEVAAVAAESVDIARRALELIDVEYEVLPAALTPRAAMRPAAPLVPILDQGQPRNGNIQQPTYHVQRGNVDAGFMEADEVVESRFRLPTQYHVDIQTRCTVADWDGERLTVYESSQGVWNVKLQLAKSLGLPEDAVRVVVKYMGGGFGSKAGAQRVVHYAARLAIMAGRPVKLELTRPEEFLSHPRRYAADVQMRLGAKRDGTLTAVECDVLLDIGSGSLYAGKYSLILHQIWELYRCPNVSVRITAVYTNTPPTGPARGVLDPIASFSMEAAMDDLAARLGLDPVDVRMRNYAAWYDETKSIPYSSKYLDRCIDTVTRAIGWDRRDELTRSSGERVRRGIGLACYCLERGGYAPFTAKAEIIARRDGAVELRAGVVEIGAGQVTVLPMIAAEELGIRPERIAVRYGDTDGTQYAPSSHASRITFEMGPATLQAAAMIRSRLFEFAAPKLGVDVDRLVATGGRMVVRGEPNRSLSFEEACGLMPDEEIRATGSRAPNPDDVIFRLFGAHAAEVEVDVETGDVRVVRFVSSHDIGRPLNPKLVESQQHGAILMGLGYGLYEEAEIDRKTGELLNPDVHQYRTPTALEAPHIEPHNVEGDDPYYPYSAKPVGEAPLIGVMPAIRNAVRHAVGVEINELPLSGPRLIEAWRHRKACDAP
jgi:CO/xanthine dehydrogenase Mo-binding subunit